MFTPGRLLTPEGLDALLGFDKTIRPLIHSEISYIINLTSIYEVRSENKKSVNVNIIYLT